MPPQPASHIKFQPEVLPTLLGHYSHVVKAGGFYHFCGIGARNPETNKEVGLLLNESGQVVGGDITLQTHQVLDNLKAALHSVGCTLEDLVDITIYLKDMRDFMKYNLVYNDYFHTDRCPARTTVEGSPPGQSYILVKAIAYKPD